MKTRFILLFLTLYLGITLSAVAQENTSQPQSVIESAKSLIPNMKPNPLIAEGYINNDAIKDTVLLVRYDKADYYDKTNIKEVKKILILSNDKGDKKKPYYYPYPLIGISQEWYSEPNRIESIRIKNTSLYLQETVNYDSGTYTTVYQFKMDGYMLILSGMEYTIKDNTGKSENIKINLSANKISFDEFNPDSIYRITGLKSSLIGDYTTHVKDFHNWYIGKIDSKYNITMYLEKNGKDITGSYKYAGQKSPLQIKGSISPSGDFTLNEYEYQGSKKITGTLSGRISETGITGSWSSPDGSKKLNLAAHVPSKKEVLQKAVGTYYLSSISGAEGANTLFDTYTENGVWKSHSSSISGGMREGQEDPLSKEDIDLLNSMYIKVDTDLAVRFFAGGKLLLEVPFNETRMKYNMSQDLKWLSPSTTFMDGKLYLAAIDGIDYSDPISSDNFLIISKNKVVLSYDPYDSFGIDISEFYGNTLTFTKE